jgi:phage/plasmid-associated DNA primase
VFLTLLQLAMQSYTEFTRPQTFLEREHDKSSNDIAQLCGVRLVVTTEPPAKKPLDESLVKQFTGILAWMVEGCVAWRMEGGLKRPQPVAEATRRHRDQMDILAPFIEEHWICAPDQRVPARKLYA